MSEEKNLPALSKEAQSILDSVKKLTVMDLANLVKHLEEEFGVSAAAPVAMVASGGAPAEASEPVEKTDFDVELTSGGGQKIAVIKVVKEATGLGLKEAKELVDAAPKIVKAKLKKGEADDLKKKLEEAGATVTLK